LSRLERLAATLDQALLVTSGVNVRYLTGMASSNAAVLVDPAGDATLYTDFRYAKKAAKVDGVDFVQTARAVIGDLATLLAGRTIGIESHVLTVAALHTLRDGGVDVKPTSGLVERLRALKEPAELDAMRAAAAISDQAFGALAEERFTGRSELELAWRMRELFHEAGSSEVSFDTMVAAAENGSSPHSDNREVAIQPNTLVIVDAGCRVDGYASDCTRTFATGPLPDELARAYEVCLAAQEAAVAAVRAGERGEDVDMVARRRTDTEGFGEAFGHGLGHGVGLLVHEDPRLAPESTHVLARGNVVTVEPGIYLSGLGGVRIEDLVVVGDGDPEVLTSFPRELTTVH
jgi:Xaa-Pro aminopeptidase